jgi:hypothetical protein
MTFVRGVNLPWLSYGTDFGRNAWEAGAGLGAPGTRAPIDQVFSRLAGAGCGLVRWFVLCDGRAGLCEDPERGEIEGVDPAALEDFGRAVRSAEAHGLALLPVLLDYHWCRPGRIVEGVRCGGRGQHLANAGARQRLLERVMRPLLSRFGGRAGIAAWDLINEPEWITFSWRAWDPVHAWLPDAIEDYIGDAAALVHACTDHPATVGLASAASLPRVRGLGLGLYQAHWYDALDSTCPLDTPVSSWGLDRPVLLGEFPTRGSARTPGQIEAAARAAGYAGALAWSVQATDAATDVAAAWRWLEAP